MCFEDFLVLRIILRIIDFNNYICHMNQFISLYFKAGAAYNLQSSALIRILIRMRRIPHV